MTSPLKDNDTIIPSDNDTLWYLAYGSNMDPKVFSGRRKIQPIESKPVIVPGYWLSFDIGGIPFVEPCFASILKMDPSRLDDRQYAEQVHARTRYGQEFVWDEKTPEKSFPPVLQGVAHKITKRDWQLVIMSEGGWGHDVPTGYNQIEVNCTLVDSQKTIPAMVLEARPVSVKTHCQPSARYKNLLTAGAAHHHLDPTYQAYLAQIVPYECVGLRAKTGRAVFLMINMPVLLSFALIVFRNRGKPANELTRPPYWAAWLYDKASRISAFVHDYFMAPIFGSGRCSSLLQQALTRKRIMDKIQEDKEQGKTEEQAQECREAEVEQQEGPVLKMAEQSLESVAE